MQDCTLHETPEGSCTSLFASLLTSCKLCTTSAIHGITRRSPSAAKELPRFQLSGRTGHHVATLAALPSGTKGGSVSGSAAR